MFTKSKLEDYKAFQKELKEKMSKIILMKFQLEGKLPLEDKTLSWDILDFEFHDGNVEVLLERYVGYDRDETLVTIKESLLYVPDWEEQLKEEKEEEIQKKKELKKKEETKKRQIQEKKIKKNMKD